MKKVLLLVLCLGILLLAGGCKSKDNTEDTGIDATPTPVSSEGDTAGDAEPIETVVNTLVRDEYNVDDYIKLGKYKGIEVTVEQLSIMEDEVSLLMQQDMQANGATPVEVTGRAVQNGDTVNIDYEGLKNGVAFEGGTDTGFDLLIGSGSFIPGFEEQIIGKNTGDKFDINVTFPDDYNTTDLAGQAVIFKVTINKIQQFEVTDEYLAANTEFTTTDAYKASFSETLRQENEAAMKTDKDNKIYNAVIEDSVITSIPQTLLDYYAEDLKVFYSNYAAAYSMDFAAFLEASGITEEQFNTDAQNYAKSMATRELVMRAIIKAEDITLSEDEFQKGIEDYVADYGYESKEALLEVAQEDILREDLLYNKAFDFILSEAIVL